VSVTTFYLYPASVVDLGGTRGQTGSYTDIVDAHDADDGFSTIYSQLCGAAATATGWSSFTLTPPTTGVTINWIRVHYVFWRQTWGPLGWNDVNAAFAGSIRPASSATYYTSTTRAVVDSGGSLVTYGAHGVNLIPEVNRNTGVWGTGTGPAHAYWEWTNNPVTASTWTVSDLQNLVVCFAFDSSKGSPNTLYNLDYSTTGGYPAYVATSIYVEVNATQAAASIEAQRLNASAFLHLFSNETEAVEVSLPLSAADADIGSTVALVHELGPSADGLGWLEKPWQRHYGMLLSKSIDPVGKKVTAKVLDLYRFHCNLWFPAVTDIGYTEEGQGVPYLDAGGGRTSYRFSTALGGTVSNSPTGRTKGYVQRQATDSLYAEVPFDKEKWSPKGLAFFRESFALIQNNSLSQGTTAFTGWLDTSTGGVLNPITVDWLFDVAGLRRCCGLVCTTVGTWAAIQQSVAGVGTGYMRVHIISAARTRTAAANRFWRLYDGANYWNDTTGAWGASANNPIATDTAPVINEIRHTYSKLISLTGPKTVTLIIVTQSSSLPGENERLYYANLWWGATKSGGVSSAGVDMQRPPFVTTTAYSYEAQDLLVMANPASARSWNPAQGTGFFRGETAWSDADMEVLPDVTVAQPTKIRMIALDYVDDSNQDAVFYWKYDANTSYVSFRRRVGGTNYRADAALTGSDRPSVGSVLRVAWRWQATGGELGLANYTIKVFVSTDSRTPITGSNTSAAWAPGTASFYLASGFSAQFDGWVRDVSVVPYVLPDDEVYRRMGV
jgi:hypothetical protein